MTKTKFGLRYWASPSPAYIKWIGYFVVGFVVYLFTNIDSSPIESAVIKKWLHWSAPFAVPALIIVRDFFGKQNSNGNIVK